jgi:xanthine dehydrogenase accessory factor
MANNTHLIAAYRQLHRQNDKLVLATIIETFGSTYQKAGARMLIDRSGGLAGLLGGGCFERDLIEHARSVFETGTPKTVFYDMRSPADTIWGLGLGCNGAVRIFLQLLTVQDNFSPLNLIDDVAEASRAGILVTVIESTHPDFPIARSLLLPDLTDRQDGGFAQTALSKPHLEVYTIGGKVIKAFHDPLHPPIHLLVLGAGADAIPLAQCAKALAWRVTVADHRPGHVRKERFPQADEVVHFLPQALARDLDLDRYDAVVLMTHHFDYDRRFLSAIAGSRIPYIGLLGPAQRRDRLLQSLDNVGERLRERVYGPVGLDIGAETPEEIALAIVAGIQAMLKGRKGGQLYSPAALSEQACHVG